MAVRAWSGQRATPEETPFRALLPGFLVMPDGTWSLAPAFDVTYAYRPESEWTSRHLMSVNGHFEGIALDDLHAVGERHEVPGYRRLVREVLEAVDRWPEFAARSEVPQRVVDRIATELDGFRPR